MIVYNVTVKANHTIANDWLTWLRKEHIPDIIATGCFTHANIFHLLEADNEEGITYVVQYHAPELSFYQNYLDHYAPAMRKKSNNKWGEQVIAFRTVMQAVH